VRDDDHVPFAQFSSSLKHVNVVVEHQEVIWFRLRVSIVVSRDFSHGKAERFETLFAGSVEYLQARVGAQSGKSDLIELVTFYDLCQSIYTHPSLSWLDSIAFINIKKVRVATQDSGFELYGDRQIH
jgi:hypothetical protein